MADKPRTSIDLKTTAAPAPTASSTSSNPHSSPGTPAQNPADGTAQAVPPKRTPGHRGVDVRDTVAEMAARAQEISQEAGSKMAAAMKDVVSAAAGITGFAVESARDLVQFMVRRGQMTQEEADKLMREAEGANTKRPPHPVPPPSVTKAAADAKAAAANAAAAAAAKLAAIPPLVKKVEVRVIQALTPPKAATPHAKPAAHKARPKPKAKGKPKAAAKPKAKKAAAKRR
jgi:polyhydroxyalkanoate synthesis regulator phasin